MQSGSTQSHKCWFDFSQGLPEAAKFEKTRTERQQVSFECILSVIGYRDLIVQDKQRPQLLINKSKTDASQSERQQNQRFGHVRAVERLQKLEKSRSVQQ